MRYLVNPTDEFAVVNHPWQPTVQHLHVITAPLLVLIIGHLLYWHAWTHWKSGFREGRRTGLTLAAGALPMIFSGYLLQTAVDPLWRQIWIAIHVSTSVLWMFSCGAHVVIHRRARRGRDG